MCDVLEGVHLSISHALASVQLKFSSRTGLRYFALHCFAGVNTLTYITAMQTAFVSHFSIRIEGKTRHKNIPHSL